MKTNLKSNFAIEKFYTYCGGTSRLIRYVKEHQVLSSNDIRYAITVIGHRPEATSCRNTLGMLFQIKPCCLPVWGLGGGQPPRFAEYFLEEGRFKFEILRYYIETEEVSIYTFTAHGILITSLKKNSDNDTTGSSSELKNIF